MKRLTVNWHALEIAFDDPSDELGMECANYFDLKSGEVVCLDEEVRSAVNCIIDELDAVLDAGADLLGRGQLLECVRPPNLVTRPDSITLA